MCVLKPPSAPAVLLDEPAPIGPPVSLALAAIWASDSGSNLPALSPAGRAKPLSQVNGLGSIFQILAARSHRVLMTFSADCVTTIGRGEGDAAAAGQVGEADAAGVADQHLDLAVVDAQKLGGDVGRRGREPPMSGWPVMTTTSRPR
jgi:hypothetical protein